MTARIGGNRLTATLPDLSGKHLPPLDLGIGIAYQCYVNIGVAAAADFIRHVSDFSLHRHFSYAAQSFATSIGAGSTASGCVRSATGQTCADAFAAGYLGRIQQELRLFQGKD